MRGVYFVPFGRNFLRDVTWVGAPTVLEKSRVENAVRGMTRVDVGKNALDRFPSMNRRGSLLQHRNAAASRPVWKLVKLEPPPL